MKPEFDQTTTHNRMRSVLETKAFVWDPPARYIAYLSSDKKRIVTWMGDTIAVVTSMRSRKVRDSYVTDDRGSFWAKGINGVVYYGTHNGAGMFCRMRISMTRN